MCLFLFLCLFVSSLSLAEFRTWWWLHLTNPQSGVKLSIPTTAEFLIGPHKLRIHEISIKFWWVFFFNLGGGWGRVVVGGV